MRRRFALSVGCGAVAYVCAVLLVGAGAAVGTATPTYAACTPVAGIGTPASGTTVTCSGTTINQNGGTDGYGDGSQTGLAINVQPGASVTGSNDGLLLNDGNTVNNSGAIQGQGDSGILAGANLVVNNAASGVISGFNSGIDATSATITNYGSISGTACCSAGVVLFDSGAVINYGIISGSLAGIFMQNTGTVTNSGTIAASDPSGAAVFIANNGTVTNTGAINAPGVSGAGVVIGGGTVTNKGTIVGGDTGVVLGPVGRSSLITSGTIRGGFAAIDASLANNAALTFLPGSRVFGDILLGNNTTVTIATGGDVGMLLTFGACGCGGIAGTNSTIVFANGTVGVVSGNSVATLDTTSFSYADRTLLDFMSSLSAVLGNRLGADAASSATAFAASGSTVVAQAGDAFSNIPGLAYANEGRITNAAAYDRASGIGVWSRGFAAARHQNADGALLAADTTSYGGMIGIDRMFASDLRLGAFVGAGASRLGVDRDSQTIKTDLLFAGLYGRKTFSANAWGTPFLDMTVSAGRTGNSSRRLVASSLAPTGFETATADYNGWFVSPEIAYGVVMPFGGRYTLTPSARLRYLAGHFGGYSESGSSQSLSVAGRTTHTLEQRAELALTYHGTGFRTTWAAGALAAERIGGSTVDTTLIGQPLSFTTPGDDTVFGAYGGFGIDVAITGAATAYVAMQGTLTSDSARTGLIQGGVRVTF